ncbi:MAG: dephospho-CoA kinase [Anaerolineae bacterium]|nr:dephospho-CoA kinase [Anaerolineae bacterium]
MTQPALSDHNALIQELVDTGLLFVNHQENLAFRHGWLAGFLAGRIPSGAPPFQLGGQWGHKAVIGVTGNIAVGKSTVLAMLGSLGAHVIDADKIVHRLRQPGAPGYNALIELLGTDILLPDGRVDTAQLARRAFDDAQTLSQLEGIFRPLVVAEVARQGWACRSEVVVIEAIKLLEGELRTQVDQVWVVDASRAQQIERLMAARGLSRQEAERRIDAQSPQEEKLAQADVVIRNDSDRSAVWQQVITAWADVLQALWHRGWLKDDLVERFIGAHVAGESSLISLAEFYLALKRLAKPMETAPLTRDQAVALLDSYTA